MDSPKITTTENIPKKRGRKPISPSQKKRNKNECRRRIYRRHLAEQGKKLKERARTAEETKAWRTERVPCECGCIIARGNLPVHRRSKKHERLMYEISTRVES